MKVVILNTSELVGGAAVAANRLMKALLKSGVEVSMLVRDRSTDDSHVIALNDSIRQRRLNFIRFIWERIVIFLCNGLKRRNLFQVSIANTGTDVSKHPLVREADVIHLHWINQGFLSLDDIKQLMRLGKPIVWTMHDLWSATGICHYPDTCTSYYSQCKNCPMLVTRSLCDLAKLTYNRKLDIDFSRVTFVGCSGWIVDQAQKSRLLSKSQFLSIPNPIDTTFFKKIDKQEARQKLGLPVDRALLLFAAAKISETRKGITYLLDACRALQMDGFDCFDIVLMGSSSEELSNQISCKVHVLGYISDLTSMVAAYSSADLFVIPSLEDNLPNTIMESMACGTPCVGFHSGGIPEMIDHKINGYVANYKDSSDLAAGIKWVLTHCETDSLSEACLKKVASHYEKLVVVEKYKKLYEHLILK